MEEHCELCEEVKTERGIWETLGNSVKKMFPYLSDGERTQILIAWYNNIMLDKRTKLIQSFKKDNIKNIKEG